MLKQLKELAESLISSTPWKMSYTFYPYKVTSVDGEILIDVHYFDVAQYVDAANPATVLKLIKVVEAAESFVESYKRTGAIGCDEFCRRINALEKALEERDE